MCLELINRLRILSKRIFPRLPFVGGWFARGFRTREACFLRREKIAALREMRDLGRAWSARTVDVVAAPDNADIPRVPNAGRIVGNDIIMHNGLRVAYGSYGTSDTRFVMRLLEKNGGVHEPQEAKIFQQVIELMPEGAVMVELGAFWGFYSLWFASRVKDARCFLVEPVWANLNAGRLNFSINGLHATFINGSVGASHRRQPFQPSIVSVDWLMAEFNLQKIHLLHSDIQGFEREMLDGAESAVRNDGIEWMMISTHTNQLHDGCRDWLLARDWVVVADANLHETHSMDGLLAAHRPGLDTPTLRPISRKLSAR
jgi:Methyltransferase FkbM domain